MAAATAGVGGLPGDGESGGRASLTYAAGGAVIQGESEENSIPPPDPRFARQRKAALLPFRKAGDQRSGCVL